MKGGVFKSPNLPCYALVKPDALNALECSLSFDKLQVDFALSLCFLNFFSDPTVVSGSNELDIPVF